MDPWIQLKKATPLFLVTFLIVWLGSSQKSEAVTPPPDGGYSGGNTVEGSDALFSLTTGANNTVLGLDALYYNTTGFDNTDGGCGCAGSQHDWRFKHGRWVSGSLQ